MEASLVLWISVMMNVLLVSRTQGAARFTVVPPSVSYVSVGETAKLVWDYSVDNKMEEFDVYSPMWIFYADNDGAFQIAEENIFNELKWNINTNTCPTRLLNPVRVSKESTATLVIHNVTLADSGTYGCVLMMAKRSPITSKVKLIVTSFPCLSINPSFSNIPVNESQELHIKCSAVGTPMPNVTWQKVQGDVINQGVGNVKIDITNITRDDSGQYECCAINNMNKPPFCKSILVTVQYEPQIDVIQSDFTVSSYNGGTIRVYCLARGVPSPLFSWFDPRNRSILTGSHTVTGVGVLELVTIDADSYGLYRCKAKNMLGYDEHIIRVIKTGHESRTKPGERSCSTLFIQGRTFATVHFMVTSISIVVNIIMALLVCYIFKRTGFQVLRKRSDNQRVSKPEESFEIVEYRIEMKTHEPAASKTPHESPNLIPPNVNVGAVSRECTPTFLDERKPKENPAEQHFLLGTQHLYRQINNGESLSREHEYQSLLRDNDETIRQPTNDPCETAQKHVTPNVNQQQQGSEYQPLHLYSSVEEK